VSRLAAADLWLLQLRRSCDQRSYRSYVGTIPKSKEKLEKILNYFINVKIKFLICLGFLGRLLKLFFKMYEELKEATFFFSVPLVHLE
jgi:hypothetical protein